MQGLLYFRDGYTEEILFYKKSDSDTTLLEFYTESGRYIYYEYYRTSMNGNVTYKTHDYYESVLSADDFGYVEERLRETDKIVRFELVECEITYEDLYYLKEQRDECFGNNCYIEPIFRE